MMQLFLSGVVSALFLLILYFAFNKIAPLLKRFSKFDSVILSLSLLVLVLDILIGKVMDKFSKTDGFSKDSILIGVPRIHEGAIKPAIILAVLIFWAAFTVVIFISTSLYTMLFD